MPSKNKQWKQTAIKEKNYSLVVKKGQPSDHMARKKEDRASNSKQRKSSTVNNGDNKSLAEQLAKVGLKVRDIIGDGNCLFRALADQFDGDERKHERHRQDVVRYMKEHRSDFEPFIEDDVPFDKHIQNLAKDGTYAGNDAIVAFARLHKLTIIIHQLDSPAWEVHGELPGLSSVTGSSGSKVQQLHILYDNNEHYSSVRRIDDESCCPANVQIVPQRSLPAVPINDDPIDSAWTDDDPCNYMNCPQQEQLCGDGDNDASVAGGDYAADFVANVMRTTKCENFSLVRTLCDDCGYYDFDLVCSQVIALMEDSMPSSPGGNSSVHSNGESPKQVIAATDVNNSVSGAKPKARTQNAAKRRQKKQEKKARAVLRHKQQAFNSNKTFDPAVKLTSSDEDDATIIAHGVTQSLKVLQI